MLFLNFGNKKLPTTIQNPFDKKGIISIHVYFDDFWNNGNWKASGRVKFKNGETTGEQKFEGRSFDDVVSQIKTMIDNL